MFKNSQQLNRETKIYQNEFLINTRVDLVYIKIKQWHHSRVRRPRKATHHGNQSVMESVRECRADEVMTALQLCVIEGSCDGAAV